MRVSFAVKVDVYVYKKVGKNKINVYLEKGGR